MAVFGALELMTCKHLTVQDKAAAHAGADEESDDIFIPLSDAVFVFTENAEIDVHCREEGNAELLFHGALDVIIPPWEIGRKQNDALS